MSSFFPFKDKISKPLRSGVVYLFKSRSCNASYVGQTTHHLHTRFSEHFGISPLTGNQVSHPALSSIFAHINATGHTPNLEDFKIISSSNDSYELSIYESLLINKYKLHLKPAAHWQTCCAYLLFVTSVIDKIS